MNLVRRRTIGQFKCPGCGKSSILHKVVFRSLFDLAFIPKSNNVIWEYKFVSCPECRDTVLQIIKEELDVTPAIKMEQVKYARELSEKNRTPVFVMVCNPKYKSPAWKHYHGLAWTLLSSGQLPRKEKQHVYNNTGSSYV